MGNSYGEIRMEKFVWKNSYGEIRMEKFAWRNSYGEIRMEKFAWRIRMEASSGEIRM